MQNRFCKLVFLFSLIITSFVHCAPDDDSKSDSGVLAVVEDGIILKDHLGEPLPISPHVAADMQKRLTATPDKDREKMKLFWIGLWSDGRTRGLYEGQAARLESYEGLRRDFDEHRGAYSEQIEKLRLTKEALDFVKSALGLVPPEDVNVEDFYRTRGVEIQKILNGEFVSNDVFTHELRIVNDRLNRAERHGIVKILDIFTSLSLRWGSFSDLRETEYQYLLVTFAVLEAFRKFGIEGVSKIVPLLSFVKGPVSNYLSAIEIAVVAAIAANTGSAVYGAVSGPVHRMSAPLRGVAGWFGRGDPVLPT